MAIPVNYLLLKESPRVHWEKIVLNNELSNVKVVGKDGSGFTSDFFLAAASPWIKDLLSSVPSHMEHCIILPQFNWEDINDFLTGMVQIEPMWEVSNELGDLLKISPGIHDTEVYKLVEQNDIPNEALTCISENQQIDPLVKMELTYDDKDNEEFHLKKEDLGDEMNHGAGDEINHDKKEEIDGELNRSS